MSTRTFNSEAEAAAFCEGVEFVNDSAVTVSRAGRVVTIDDDDEPVPPASAEERLPAGLSPQRFDALLDQEAHRDDPAVRIVVCIDVQASDPAEAYAELWRSMRYLCEENPRIDWESSDEWFGADGEQLTEEQITAARAATLERQGGAL